MRRWKPWKFGENARTLPVVTAEAAPSGQKCQEMGLEMTPREGRSSARRRSSSSPPETLEAIINNPGGFVVKKRREWDIVKYARLYTGETYPVGASHDVVAKDCWLHTPSGTVITRDKQVVAFSSYSLDSFYRGHSEVSWEDAPLIEQTSFKLATVWGRNFAHWLMDALPKADALSPGDERLIVLDRNAPDFQGGSLRLLGLKDGCKPEGSLLRFRELHFVSTFRSGVPDPRPLLRIRTRLQSGAGVNFQTKPRRIYISRQKTRRKILNHDQVWEVLRDFGFEEVFCEQLDFAEQVRLFSSAEAIFGAHGAGTLNVLFAPPGAALIEAYNPQVWDHAAHRVASLVGVRHFHLFAEHATREFDVRVNPRTLARTLALALDPPDVARPALVEEIF